MNVLSIVMGSDPAGISIGMARAFSNDSDYTVQSLISHVNYIEYPIDLEWDRKTVADHWEWADVIHLHHSFVTAERMKRGYSARRVQHKPYVVEYHGTGFRENSGDHLREQRRYQKTVPVVGLTSTLDLWLLAPDQLEWAPPPIDVRRLKAMKRAPTGRVLICHAPTNRAIKSTERLVAAVERLQQEGFGVDVDIIEHRPWVECLKRKAKADIYFDQVILGYGCNALEAWGMGIPVVAGASDETLDEMERRFGQLPFYHATEETIYDALKELVESPELRAQYGQIGHDYVRKYHDYPVVVEQLKAIYQQALAQVEEAA